MAGVHSQIKPESRALRSCSDFFSGIPSPGAALYVRIFRARLSFAIKSTKRMPAQKLIEEKMVAGAGIEPATQGFSVLCSTN